MLRVPLYENIKMALEVNLSGDVFTSPYSTEKCTILLLSISFRISPYMFQLNYHQGAETILLKLTAIK